MSEGVRYVVEWRNPEYSYRYSHSQWSAGFQSEEVAVRFAKKNKEGAVGMGVRVVKVTREIVYTDPPATD